MPLNTLLISLAEALVVVTALSTDTLAAGFGYGAGRIRLPFSSVAVVSLICSAMLGLSLGLGSALRPLLPQNITRLLCFGLLFGLGLVKLCDSRIKRLIRRRPPHRQVSFTLCNLHFLLTVYADPQQADSDRSQCLSLSEAVSLAAALSLDGLAVGFGAAVSGLNPWLAVSCSFLLGLLALPLGSLLGRRVAERLPLDLSWLSGALLMGLALLKL